MKKNAVILSLKNYNELREFKDRLEEQFIVKRIHTGCDDSIFIEYKSLDDSIEDVRLYNAKLYKHNEELHKINNGIINENSDLQEKIVNLEKEYLEKYKQKLKNYSFWKLVKLKLFN
jgi:hypothetical protein